MIIWGYRNRLRTIGNGTFYCPQCRSHSQYQHVRVSRYFTLYFIPLFPMQTLGEAIRCGGCRGEFKQNVLALTQAQVEALTAPWNCAACGNRNPASEGVCLGCGVPRSAAPPPLAGGQQKALPQASADKQVTRVTVIVDENPEGVNSEKNQTRSSAAPEGRGIVPGPLGNSEATERKPGEFDF